MRGRESVGTTDSGAARRALPAEKGGQGAGFRDQLPRSEIKPTAAHRGHGCYGRGVLPCAAVDCDELVSEKAARLIDHPRLGRPGRIRGTREFAAHRNYILIYGIAGDLVRVLHVLHAAKVWPLTKKRP